MDVPEVILDYETRCDLPLEEVGAIEYGKKASIFCLGYQINDEEPRLWIPEKALMPDDLWQAFQSGILIAHNAAFERAITTFCLTRYDSLTEEQRELLLSLPPSRWRCLAAKAAMCGLPRSLDGATRALELMVQKDTVGHKLIKKYSRPRKPTKNNPSIWWNDRKNLRRIYRYCLTDIKAEVGLHRALPDLSPFEQSVWELDQKINDRGVLIDIPVVKKILTLVQEETKDITKRVNALSNGEVGSASERAKVLKWVNERGANLANLQAATIRDRLLDSDLPEKVRTMLEYRQGGSKTSTAKYLSMIKAVGADNRARELLLYCGATPTARWAGKRVQPQNFPRPTVKEPGKNYFDSDLAIDLAINGGRKALADRYGENKVMDVLVSIIRGMIIASPGSELFCADFAAVEARIAFWLAEHIEGVLAFLNGAKLYEEMASEAFGIPLEEIIKESLERFLGKESILGCQYGLGWKKFLMNCHQKGMKQVTEDMAKKIVYAYRKVHHPVPEFWDKIEKACLSAVANPGKRYRVTKVEVYVTDKWLNIKLPSGRRLRYFKPRITMKQLANKRLVPEIRYWTVDSYTKQWTEVSIWGGVFFNHCVQGIARDLMVNGVINIENAAYSFLMSIHDEGLSEHKKGVGNLDEYVKLMTKLPEWAHDAPITAEGWSGKRYKKG